MKKRALKLYLIVQALLCAFSFDCFALQGENGSRGRYPPKKEPRKAVSNIIAARRGGRRSGAGGRAYKWPKGEVNKEPKPVLVTLAVVVSPPDSTVLVNGQKFHSRDQSGRQITNLEPGTYLVTASRPGYVEQSQSVLLIPRSAESVSIVLRPRSGKMSIKPTIADSDIVVLNKDKALLIGRYSGSVADLNVEPGQYEVTISKNGYQTTKRDIIVKPGESVYLEPLLEKEAFATVQVPPSTRPTFTPSAAMSAEIFKQDKYIVVSLNGRSGDTTAAIGSLAVIVSIRGDTPEGSTVVGMLSGFPCQVDFVRIENIAEYSFAETPGPANQWAKVVVRLRPKDSKRPIHFSINWKSLQAKSMQTTDPEERQICESK
jgi:hypothetical protein